MKITKRQLRRIIKEEKAKILSEVSPRKTIEYQGEEWIEAFDELNEALVNLVANALDAGLLEDDVDDAWAATKTYVSDMLGGF